MIVRLLATVSLASALVVYATGARAESKGCAEIVAAADEAGGALSADEFAKKLSTNVETVRNCLDKRPQAGQEAKKPAGGAQAPAK